jgi:hypothetical protein
MYYASVIDAYDDKYNFGIHLPSQPNMGQHLLENQDNTQEFGFPINIYHDGRM